MKRKIRIWKAKRALRCLAQYAKLSGECEAIITLREAVEIEESAEIDF